MLISEDQWDVWIPLALGPRARDQYNGFYLYAIARMKRGVTLPQTRNEMAVLGASIYREHADLSGWEVESNTNCGRGFCTIRS